MKSKFVFLFIAVVGLVLQSCFTFTTLSTGRTIGKGTHEIMPSLASYYVDGTSTTPVLPQLSYTYGLGKRLDVGANLSLAITGLHAKYQVVGDQDSDFCLATGIQYNYFGVRQSATSGSSQDSRISLSNLAIPLYTSWHPTERFALYLTPKLIRLGGQKSAQSNSPDVIWMTGVTPGLEFGGRARVIVEANIISPLTTTDNFSKTFATFAVGGKFRIN